MDVRAQPQPSALAMYRALVGIGVVCGLLIVAVYEGTKPMIDANKAEALERAIFRVLPKAKSSRTFVPSGDGFESTEGPAQGERVYAGYDESGALIGLALEAAGMGYADTIHVLYGYDFEAQAIAGLVVLQSKETPGLGDKIEKDPAFLKNFEALDVRLDAQQKGLANEIVAVKSGAKTKDYEVDGITGATISSKAIAALLQVSASRWVPKLRVRRLDFEAQAEGQP